jgi:hypothetical protein
LVLTFSNSSIGIVEDTYPCGTVFFDSVNLLAMTLLMFVLGMSSKVLQELSLDFSTTGVGVGRGVGGGAFDRFTSNIGLFWIFPDFISPCYLLN